MSNGKMKTIMTRRSLEFDNFLDETIRIIKENGFPAKLQKVHIERLLTKHKASREIIQKAIIDGFRGVTKLSPQASMWMTGERKNEH
jgi:hypothetical protein